MSTSPPWQDIPPTAPVALRIAADAADAIVTGATPAGALITESGIAEPLGASRTPAREAMVQLSRWGLVRLVPKKGAVVTTVSTADRRDLLEVRLMFESRAAQLLADDRARRDSVVTHLRDAVAAQRRALADHDLQAFAGQDVAFHLAVIAATENKVVDELMASLAPRLARLIHLAVSDNPEAATVFCQEHSRMAELLAAGDSSGYVELLATHIAAGHVAPGEFGRSR
ncbi:GntR family transcriptional regulator [Aestuariimicrobium kwangyangense]|uniref:GntR family transcriptional regulator n=1 Tax=Aestuariimicrobium kwangyangense TaxID=396389 RepID=UPI0003B40BB9|nr:GntR family transcriptional regulator [Aestuariimicrobium kwangyangense]